MAINRNYALLALIAGIIDISQAIQAEKFTYEGIYPATATGATPMLAEAGATIPPVDPAGLTVLDGDVAILLALPAWQPVWDAWGVLPDGQRDRVVLAQQISQLLQDAGYVFAAVLPVNSSVAPETQTLWVSAGRQGTVAVQGNSYYSAEQLLRMMRWNSGSAFNYRDFFNNLYQINRRSYLEVESELQPYEEEGQRIVNAIFTVEEGFPGNVSWRLSNEGGEQTSEWRSRLQGQVSNLLKLDGTLKGSWLTDPTHVNIVNSFSGSYAVILKDCWDVVTYGGYSESNFNEVQPEIDLFGRGYYAGWVISRELWDAESFALTASLGWMFLNSESTSDISGNVFSDSNTQLSMPRLAFSYVPKDYDRWGGKNYISNTIIMNWADFAGSSDNQKFSNRDGRVDGTFVLNRFELSRFQKLWDDAEHTGAWSLFANLTTQLTSEALPSSMRKSLGGVNTVRGYRERIVSGDYGYRASLELRMPLLTNFIPGLARAQAFLRENPHYWGQHRLQFITFVDAGHVQLHKPSSGQTKSYELYGAGVGLRAGLTTYSQFTVDLGFPLKTLPSSNSNNPRIHLALELNY